MGQSDTIPALQRSIEVLTGIAEGLYFHSIAELSRQLGIPQTTCYRIVRTLLDADWLRPRSEGVGYELSYGLLPLLKPFETNRVLVNVIQPALMTLVEQAGLSAKISTRFGHDAITIHRVEANRPITLSGRVGVHFHIAHGSSGAALLSGLADQSIEKILDEAPAVVWEHQTPEDVWGRIRDCRGSGWCMDLGGYSPQIHTITGAVGSGDGGVRAAITLLGMPGDLDPPRRDRLIEAVLACLARCRAAMDRSQRPSGKAGKDAQ
jgi:DNA-binding IclR family transcriptional regulator